MYYDKKKETLHGSVVNIFCKYVAEIKHCYLNVSKPNVSWLYLPSVSEYAEGQSSITSVLNVGSEHVELNRELWKLTCTPSSLFSLSHVTRASERECSPLSLTRKLCEMCFVHRKMHLVKVLTWTLWNVSYQNLNLCF